MVGRDSVWLTREFNRTQLDCEFNDRLIWAKCKHE